MADSVFQPRFPSPEPSEPKTTFRAWVRQVRKGLHQRDLDDISRQIEGHAWGIVIDNSLPDSLASLMVYVPIRGEIDPIFIASRALGVGWRICVGRGTSTTSTLQCVAVDPAFLAGGAWHRDGCEPDAWGMPVPRDHVPVRAAGLTAVLVPGLAFDEHGNRLGRGAGVYDRFLATLPPSVLRVGLCPEALVVPALPTEPHDVPMHFVVTERRAIAGAPVAR